MPTFQYNSWGRTRSPKNLAGGVQGKKVAVLPNTDVLKGVTESSQGYVTENQRYLHVLIEDRTTSDDPAVTTIYGYCHAFQRWFEIPESEAGGEGQNTANAAASIDIGNIARLPPVQVPSDREYRRYEIVGIDRVAFVNGTPAEVNVFAACSTF
jgi:hypothetical protein